MKLSKLIFLLLGVVLLTVAVTVTLYMQAHKLPQGTRSVPYLFYVADGPGIDAGTDIFRLGAVPPTGSSNRALELGTPSGQPTVLSIFVRGEGAEWISIDPPTLLTPGSVNISVSLPADAPFGTYRGEILVVPGNYTP